MTGRLFVDTNLLIYQFDTRESGGDDLDGLRVVDPFRVSPDALISSGLS